MNECKIRLGPGDYKQDFDSGYCAYVPRILATTAMAVALLSILVLGFRTGIAGGVVKNFRITCMTIAKWAAIVSTGCVVVSLLGDMLRSYHDGSTVDNARLRRWASESLSSLLSPCGACWIIPSDDRYFG